jgi:hypothetical protein
MIMGRSELLLFSIIAVLIISGCTSTAPPPDDGGGGDQGDARVYVPAGTPREAFEAYRQAIDDGDFDSFRKSVPSSIVRTMDEQIPGGMSDENFRQVFSMIKSFMVPVDDVLIEDEKSGSGWANWTVSDKDDPKTSGTISFEFEDGGWKVLKEEWKSSL